MEPMLYQDLIEPTVEAIEREIAATLKLAHSRMKHERRECMTPDEAKRIDRLGIVKDALKCGFLRMNKTPQK